VAESDDTGPSDADRAMLQHRHNARTDTRLQRLESQLAALRQSIRSAGPGTPPPTAGPVSFLLLDDEERGLTLAADLLDWVDRVYLRFSDTRLPTCWLWHPDVIEELFWLRHAHADAYGPNGSWQRIGDWHDRYRPRVAERIRRYAGTCQLSQHAPGKPQGLPVRQIPLVSAFNRMIKFWMRPDSATAPRPEPTTDELTEANREHHAPTT
jgi:hypothetical protein